MALKEQEDPESWEGEPTSMAEIDRRLKSRFVPAGLRRPEVEPETVYTCNFCLDWTAPRGMELWEILKTGDFTKHNQAMHEGNASLIRAPVSSANPGPQSG